MQNKIQQAFEAVQAGEKLKGQTQSFLSQRLYHPARKPSHPVKRLSVVMACIVALLLGGGYYTYITPVIAISVDVNPSFELNINRYDRVISVDGYNEDGEALVSLLNVKHLPYTQAIKTILDGDSMKSYLADGELISLVVAGGSEKQNRQMLNVLEEFTEQKNVSCHAVDAQAVEDAHTHNLSFGKYSAYLTLYELDPTITLDEIRGLSMCQIRDRISRLSVKSDTPHERENGYNHDNDSGHNKGHGGNGWRGGRN